MFLKTMLQSIKKEKGAVIVMTAVMLPLLLGLAGLGFDVGNLYVHKARLQNVADAAALAGAREYIDSQKYVIKDRTDSDYTAQGEVIYTESVAPASRSGNHPNADEAADKYIHKNIANLHNTVKSDASSHLALESGDGERVFYRIGLNEQVRLHFLPVILGEARNQTVSAEAIAVVEPGKTQVNTVANAQKYSIFENLVTYSGLFDSGLSNEVNLNVHGNQSGKINVVFEGKLVYSFENGTGGDSFYDMDDALEPGGNYFGHLLNGFTNLNPNEKPNNYTNKHWVFVNDPTINTLANTTAYADAFRYWISGGERFFTKEFEGNLTLGNTDFDNLMADDYNVIYLKNSGENNAEVTINLDRNVGNATNVTPIYVIIENTVKLNGINCTATQEGRPLVIVYYGTNSFALNVGTETASAKLNAVIYAPYLAEGDSIGAVNFYLNGTFQGNVIAPGVVLTAKSGSQSVLRQKNYLENGVNDGNGNYTTDANAYKDKYIAAVTAEIAANVQSRLPDKAFLDRVLNEYMNVLKNDFGMDDKELKHRANKNFYGTLEYNIKKALYEKWLSLRQNPAYAQYADFLWPWGNENLYEAENSTSNGDTYTTIDYSVGTLRLINPRTEYTESNPFASAL